MTYIFNSNNNIINEVEIKNDVGNTIPISGNVVVYHQGLAVGNSNPLPVSLGSDTINIVGNIAIPTTVNVASSPENPVHVHLTELGGNGSGNGIILTTYVPIQGNVTVNNFPASQNVVVTNSIPVTGNVTVLNSEDNPAIIKFADNTNVQLDTQDRLRVALQGQQWWYVASVDKDGDLRFNEKASGANANSYFIQNFAAVKITSGTDANGSFIRASRRRHKIRPGISHQYISIHNFDGIQANTTKRVGMFTSFNGIFFELKDDLYVVVRRRLIDGTLVEDRVARKDFNIDRLDGTGPTQIDLTSNPNYTINLSGYAYSNTINIAHGWANNAPSYNTQVYNVTFNTSNAISSNVTLGSKVTVTGITPSSFNTSALIKKIDNANNQVTLTYIANPGTYSSMSSGRLTHTLLHHVYSWWFDFNGARTSKIRFGINGPYGPSVVHIANYYGQLSEQYESAPALMDRIELVNTGTVNYLPSFTTHGTTFNTEAEVELNPGFGTALCSVAKTFSKLLNEEFAIMGIGLRAGEPYQRSDMQLQGVQIMDLSNLNLQNSTAYQWRLVLNPTLTGVTVQPTNIGKSSRFWDYNQGVTSSGGIDLMGGFTFGSQSLDVRTALNFLNMGSNIDYTDSDTIVLVVKQLSKGTADGSIIAGMNYIEAL